MFLPYFYNDVLCTFVTYFIQVASSLDQMPSGNITLLVMSLVAFCERIIFMAVCRIQS